MLDEETWQVVSIRRSPVRPKSGTVGGVKVMDLHRPLKSTQTLAKMLLSSRSVGTGSE